MGLHGGEERQQVRFGRRTELHGDVDVGHSKRFDAAALVPEGVTRVVVQGRLTTTSTPVFRADSSCDSVGWPDV